MSKTKWEKIVSDKDLASAKTYRSKSFIEKKERAAVLNELVEEGWIKHKDYADKKFIGVKREKPFDEQFEDKVWIMFANMGFTHMNKDRKFEMSYDFRDPNFTQQIDVFAADDETVVIVECKSAERLKNGNFKQALEALKVQMDGLRKEANRKFPNRKVKFIWATNNLIMGKSDLSKINEWGIIHFNTAVIDYYIELAKHLGVSAKYQLLGNLFANTPISNMDEKIPAIQGRMGGHIYYSFSIEPERLLKIGYVLHRNEANKNMMPTYQRLIKKKRLQDVKQFINKGGYFPNSIIININTDGKKLRFDQSAIKLENSLSKIGVLHLPKKYRSAYIIDGQHRLYGYSNSQYACSNSIPVVAFVNLDRKEQIKLFMDINENQKAVPKTLRVTLNADMLWDSEDYSEQRQALRSKIAQMLGECDTSPLFSRVVVGENESSPIKCITVEAIQLALKKCSFFTMFGKKNAIIKDGTFDLGINQTTCDLFYPFIEDCLKYIKDHTESEWSKGDTEFGIVTINRGIQASIRVISDIVDMLVANSEISPKIDDTDNIVEKIKYYLDPLIDYINNSTLEQKKELRSYLGGSADTRFLRTFQKAIYDSRSEFCPEGLKEYWLDEAKTFNEESLSFLREISSKVKDTIKQKLEKQYGDAWTIKGLPRTVYNRAKTASDAQNYDRVNKELAGEELSLWDSVSLTDCKDIILSGRNWTDHFEEIMVRPEDKGIAGGKQVKTEWLIKLNSISNNLLKANYSVPSVDYSFIKEVHNWLLS